MEKIASFTVNHKHLTQGMYTSRKDGDIVTYDLRFRRPNREAVLSNAALHTIEHLMATVLRNGELAENVIYFGPMGCRTGFYLLLRNVNPADAIRVTVNALKAVSDWRGEIPGTTDAECGNYREHDLEAAKKEAAMMLDILKDWTKEKLTYQS
ncbi:MAG TPA: S-ribosylhomocysteine lyase [Oscillospiraceae bacterium]|nr:S-ribosylhomocysteine lyase [Oscillospiraceae bacterium]HPF56825.1 S-ribosylhomocysteine lyase [Clostridiales bacterium]HPK36515.1 S-ribosylhomocysteine lyase [Oscillospiraceae bacterium]HPR75748.1 S-ribosylhomocysteine lyase [Oscillospiraceae bacterium]